MENSIAVNKEYEIKLATKDESGKIVEFLNTFFYGHDPITKTLFREVSNKAQFLLPIVNAKNIDTIKEELSLIAVLPSGEIIGASINESLKPEASSSTLDIGKLINQVNAKMNEKVQTENEMLTRILVVHPDWKRKGIASALLYRAIDIARQHNFNQIRGHCTNAYSAKIYEKCAFQYVYSLPYEDFKPNGKAAFTPELPHTHVHGMALRLKN